MHVLWLIPGYYSFLVDELTALRRLVEKISVVSQADPVQIPGIRTEKIPRTPRTAKHLMKRLRNVVRAGLQMPFPVDGLCVQAFLSAVRKSEFIADFIRDEGVDVVHSHFAWPQGTAGRLGCGRCPTVLTLRGVDILVCEEVGYGFLRDPYYRRTLRTSLAVVDAVTVASSVSFGALQEFYGSREHKFHLIPNGIDLTRFDWRLSGSGVRSRLGIGDSPVVLAVGNLVPSKAFDRLIAALVAVRSVHPRTVAIILGEGEQRGFLEDQARGLGVGDAVILPGRVEREEVAEYFAACDVFAQSSLTEAFGNVVLEAMAMGCAVVATRTGVVMDLVEDGRTGISVPVGQVSPLGQSITRFLSDRALAERCGCEARRRVLAADMSMSRRAERFVDLYEGLRRVGGDDW